MKYLKSRTCRQCNTAFLSKRHNKLYCSFECRFWFHVDKRGTQECWPWKGYRWKTGHGRIRHPNKGTKKAHRLAYELTVGSIPRGRFVCHSCHNASCCNPNHLYVGTNDDNVRDREVNRVQKQAETFSFGALSMMG